MDFRIADTFTDSLARLTRDEQKAAKTTAFDMQLDPASPGMQFHKLDRARDKNFWSVRVDRDIRLIVHRTEGSLLLCYVGHHDDAYRWAERRKLETHATTGAAQLVELQEMVREVIVPRYVDAPAAPVPAAPVLAHIPDNELLEFGVPADWLSQVRAASEDTLLDVAAHLPAEAAEAVLQLATGGKPEKRIWSGTAADAFAHPDAKRRFLTVVDADELAAALEYPWDKWAVFLHPSQREAVERDYSGPARISGTAGTGKTIVALHRAAHLARSNPEARILLTTFSDPLANALRTQLRRLVAHQPRLAEQLDVAAIDAIARRLFQLNLGKLKLAARDTIRELILQASAEQTGSRFSIPFLFNEWHEVIDEWQIESWDGYRDVARLGRKIRLPEKQREALWTLFATVRSALESRGLITEAEMYTHLAKHFANSTRKPFEHVIVDEAQDVGVAQLRFLAALGGDRPNALFFTGDLGQRIFQIPFSWKSLGVNITGRSRTLRVNYRTSQQIRAHADRLLGPELVDIDGNVESRRGTISAFSGPEPAIEVLEGEETEIGRVAAWLRERTAEGVPPAEMAVFVRSESQTPRARAAVERAGLQASILDDRVEVISGRIPISTMHYAKGLEFRAVAVMACDDGVIPLEARMRSAAEDSDLEEVYNTERHLLYVALTRARNHLLVTATEPASEFLEDLAS